MGSEMCIRDRTKRPKLCAGERRMYRTALSEWDLFMANGQFPKRTNNREYFSEEMIDDIVRFIYHGNNCQVLSWGSRRVQCNGRFYVLPNVLRKFSGQQMWARYDQHRRKLLETLKKEKEETEDEIRRVLLKRKMERIRPIGRTTFCEIVSSLTGAKDKRKSSVDYILDTLVYDNIKTLIRLVEEEVTDQLERVIMTNRLRGVLEYLKFYTKGMWAKTTIVFIVHHMR